MTIDYEKPRDLFIRIAALYFGLHALAIPFDTGNGPRRLFEATWGTLNVWFAETVFGVTHDRSVPKPLEAVSQHVLVLLIATIGALLWMAIDNRQSVTDAVHRIMRVGLRYYVGIITMIYGSAKVIPLQFPQPSLDLIVRPFGELTPMSLLWNFMGYSPAYTVFTGIGEWVGAFLLFFRRTTTLGALILAAVLANVVLLNYAYGVFVKTLSTNLLLGCLVLIAPDAFRVIKVFVLNQPVDSSPLVRSTRSARAAKVRRVVKPLVIMAAAVAPLMFAAIMYSTNRQRSPLYGVYEASAPASGPDAWRTMVFDRRGSMSVITGDDQLHRYRAAVDTTADSVQYWARSNKSDARSISFRPLDSTTFAVVRELQGVTSTATFRRVSLEKYSLLRPFRWR